MSIGLEANPIALLASQVKTDWSIDPFEIIETAKLIFDKTKVLLITKDHI